MSSGLRRLLGLATPYGRRIALAVLLGFGTIVSGIGLLTTSAYLIAKAALGPSIAALQVAIVGVRFFGIARGGLRYLERVTSHDINFRLLASLRVWFYQALEPLAPARLERFRSGDLMSRIVADVSTLENLYVRVIAPPVVASLVGVSMFFFLARYSIYLGLILLGALLFVGVVLPLGSRRLGRAPGRRMVRARAEMSSVLVDGVQGMPEIVAFCGQASHLGLVKRLGHELAALQHQMASITGLSGAVAGLVHDLAVIGALAVGATMIGEGRLEGVMLPVVILAVMSSFEAVLPLPQAFQYLESSLEAGRRLFEIVDTTPGLSESPPRCRLERSDQVTLEVADLTMRYQPHHAPAIEEVSFRVDPGGRIAVVGPSGAGKTTLIRVLLGFWEAEKGTILLDGKASADLGWDQARKLYSVVSQQPYLFDATLRQNLMMARPEATEDEMHQSAMLAQLHEFAEALPQGYDTWIGERGLQLSGGERQRLAIARAVLRDAPILVLDEAGANLDAITEQQVMDSLERLMRGRAVLAVTHRLVGLERVDEILVLREGRIVERGRHHELIQMRGLYWRMWSLQHDILRMERNTARAT